MVSGMPKMPLLIRRNGSSKKVSAVSQIYACIKIIMMLNLNQTHNCGFSDEDIFIIARTSFHKDVSEGVEPVQQKGNGALEKLGDFTTERNFSALLPTVALFSHLTPISQTSASIVGNHRKVNYASYKDPGEDLPPMIQTALLDAKATSKYMTFQSNSLDMMFYTIHPDNSLPGHTYATIEAKDNDPTGVRVESLGRVHFKTKDIDMPGAIVNLTACQALPVTHEEFLDLAFFFNVDEGIEYYPPLWSTILTKPPDPFLATPAHFEEFLRTTLDFPEEVITDLQNILDTNPGETPFTVFKSFLHSVTTIRVATAEGNHRLEFANRAFSALPMSCKTPLKPRDKDKKYIPSANSTASITIPCVVLTDTNDEFKPVLKAATIEKMAKRSLEIHRTKNLTYMTQWINVMLHVYDAVKPLLNKAPKMLDVMEAECFRKPRGKTDSGGDPLGHEKYMAKLTRAVISAAITKDPCKESMTKSGNTPASVETITKKWVTYDFEPYQKVSKEKTCFKIASILSSCQI